jgi:dTDP-4-amino-4,6-dideoxygalactose transaminase
LRSEDDQLATQLFVPTFAIDECLAEIRECLERGWTGIGYKTVEFEKIWSEYTGLPHSHFLNSATSGLHLALELLKKENGWSSGDEVITTPLTFVSTNHAILYAGLTPVFADVDEYLCLDPSSIEARLSDRTKAVIFVGMGGNAGQLSKVVELCHDRGIKLILDAAHMAGTRVHGKHVGSEVDAAVFSFQAVKNLPTADSGMICFPDQESDARARRLTWLGIDKDTYARTAQQGAYKWMYEVDEIGYKYHGNSIMAAIGLVQLKYLDRDNAYRRQLASWYRDLLDAKVRVVQSHPDCESAQHLLQIRVSNRNELMLALNEHEIYPGVHYRDNREYSIYQDTREACPNAAAASREVISLPLHLRLSRADVEHISELVLRYAA